MDTVNAKITVLGSFVVDLAGIGPHLPKPGETVLGSYFKLGPGGKGSNQAVAARRCGADVTMISKLGRDTFSKIALDSFSNEGISHEYVYQDENYETGAALIMVDEKAENSILVIPGANNHITDEEILKAEESIKESKVFLTQLETNLSAVNTGIAIAKRHGVEVILNPAPYQPVPEELFKSIDYITPNETEAEALTGVGIKGVEDAKKAAAVLLDKGVKNVIITLGKGGALLMNREQSVHVPARVVESVDTTGAGDAFNGGFATALSEGKSIIDAVRFGNIVASISVTRRGTAPAMPYRHEVDEIFNNM